jgi:hypothetical protein
MNTSHWQHELVDRLAERIPAGYDAGGEPAAEPTALAGLALAAHGRLDAAQQASLWLAKMQARTGSVGVTPAQPTPCWPTSVAMLLWKCLDAASTSPQFADSIDRAVHWTLQQRGKTLPRNPQFGHDSTLVGWSWAANTHSWIEPTAMFVLALKAVGQSPHDRTREAVRLLIDRLLPNGGCNYGNTIVLGQTLLAHLQPTGLAMMALAGEGYDDPRIERSLNYLRRQLSAETATASLCYGLLGLAAHGRTPTNRDDLLQNAYIRVRDQDASPYKLALIALAATQRYPFRADAADNRKAVTLQSPGSSWATV